MSLYLIKRVLTRVRNDCPSMVFLPGFICGQVATVMAGAGILSLCGLLAGIAIFWCLSGTKRVLMLSWVCGALSAALSWQPPSTIQLDLKHSYLVHVFDSPRYPKVGRMVLPLEILQEGTRSRRAFDWQTLPLSVRALCSVSHLPWRNTYSVDEGSLFFMRAEFFPIPLLRNPFARAAKLRRDGYSALCKVRYATRPVVFHRPWMAMLRGKVADAVRAVLGEGERAGLLLSMSIGSRDVLSSSTERVFKDTGLAHLLVLSGYQVTLVYYLIFIVARTLTAPLLVRQSLISAALPPAIFACVVCICFVGFSGVEAPSIRAAIAALLTVVSSSIERGGGMWNGIVVSFLVLAALWPCIYCEAGVELTYAALVGIAFGSSLPLRGTIAKLLAVCTCASCSTAAVSMLWFGKFSLIGFLLNPVIAPLLGVLSCKGGLIAIGAYLLGLDPHGFLIQWLAITLEWIVEWVRVLSKLPISYLEFAPGAGACVAAAIAVGACYFFVHRFRSYLRHRGVWC